MGGLPWADWGELEVLPPGRVRPSRRWRQWTLGVRRPLETPLIPQISGMPRCSRVPPQGRSPHLPQKRLLVTVRGSEGAPWNRGQRVGAVLAVPWGPVMGGDPALVVQGDLKAEGGTWDVEGSQPHDVEGPRAQSMEVTPFQGKGILGMSGCPIPMAHQFQGKGGHRDVRVSCSHCGVPQFQGIPISHAPGYGDVIFLWHGGTPTPGSGGVPGMSGYPSPMEWGTLIL